MTHAWLVTFLIASHLSSMPATEVKLPNQDNHKQISTSTIPLRTYHRRADRSRTLTPHTIISTKPIEPTPTQPAITKHYTNLNWTALAQCESNNTPTATSPNGKYRGLYQFDLDTWHSVGGTGDPATASRGEQQARAEQLYASRGSQPWQCGWHLHQP
jgi:hypothetical protein